ncbi:ComEA family DNA-binding protein [Aliamphritea ceti]|uniref:ComEA family DNA-binding protein n=1 Tax=Aliamphritea ceti TaxID=1524258 RepID=UPI0021C4AB26|nr:helix-hairpin-helix domain-containing protein [Aliamphritea ceti]
MLRWNFYKTILVSIALIFSTYLYAGDHQLDINKASAAQLAEHLSGVGAKKADAIVAYRDELGGFSSLEQLKDVNGIGAALFAKNLDRITLSESAVVLEKPDPASSQ